MIRKTSLLILCILAGQFICVTAGVFWYGAWQETIWNHALRDQFETHNVLTTAQAAAKLGREFELPAQGALDPTQEAKLQQFVESVSLPNRWYLCVLDRTGTLLAHPRLPQEPQLRRTRPGYWLLHIASGQKEIPLLEALTRAPEGAVAGWVNMADGTHLIAARQVPESGLIVVAQQQARALEPLLASITAPVRRVGVAIAAILVVLTGLVTRLVMSRYENKLAGLNRELERKVRERSAALVATRDAVIFGLAKLADSRDRETGEHLERLQHLVALLARELRPLYPEIGDAWIESLRLAAALHDIGKVGIPDAILLKPGPLTPEERRIMQRHTQIGGDCLAAIGRRLGENDFLAMACDIAYCHHERWDGRGYPRGLKGAAIPLAARIVALADFYDAVSSNRVYRAARRHDDVVRMIVEGCGKHFDPAVVYAFLSVEQTFYQMNKTALNAVAAGPASVAPPVLVREELLSNAV